ncbi:MAG: bifunctional phosphoribosylaminoimidazolecarboxamide formyltransferase/IMP cyclohydrolase PurH [SAR86 cluster bacterium]|jgi:phosphoribosylaminoimidazolecarboxamide formyltransferase/IMP cyclohydrolase|nr:MAG: bifunctional phosphoribosylaminoimidazolecarboxamide formyltransferase/IMP cyclohydrolase PurH [SAR86 cluster bacterium]URQ69412.1 bifunctional phosphoribosylaminoimidazolecarboxamide formyltransferase/IMP cyclohydrolase [SAR86 cluster bacterium]|tara:strand:- start:2403 stop:3944 length:1542 start_codon:yes stop_codon:yes gene_type:complete
MNLVSPKTALISLSDKSELKKLINFLDTKNIKILSTGGTYKAIKEITSNVIEVSEFTGFKEMMEGRVKTLHPKIHAGILARRDKDLEVLANEGYEPIDLVIVNLYPFKNVIAKDCSFEEAIENIDIGGPTMIRSAAKNFKDVVVVSDPKDYENLINEWEEKDGISYDYRKYLSLKVFELMADYNKSIADYLNKDSDLEIPNYSFSKKTKLRYGENPHQKASLLTFANLKNKNIANAHIIQGKELSYNNIVDADAAWSCVKEFKNDACVIVKHANPCGVAESSSVLQAYDLAFRTDPTSAFGGIIAFNKMLDAETAKEINDRQFVELVIAPKFDDGAIKEFNNKKNVRVLEVDLENDDQYPEVIKKVSGGILIQSDDLHSIKESELKCVTKRNPTSSELEDMIFAWKVAKFVKSNAIVYVKDKQTVGIGAGQMSRVISAEIANIKAKEEGLEVKNAAMASDAFFPFRDGIDKAASSGISAIIQPGGSIKDNEVIAAADEANIAMLYTGVRHFRH